MNPFVHIHVQYLLMHKHNYLYSFLFEVFGSNLISFDSLCSHEFFLDIDRLYSHKYIQ